MEDKNNPEEKKREAKSVVGRCSREDTTRQKLDMGVGKAASAGQKAIERNDHIPKRVKTIRTLKPLR